MRTETAQTPESVLNELRSLVSEAETLLGQPSGGAACNCEETLAALRERLAAGQEQLAEAYQGAKQKVVAGAKCADATIRDNPYQSLAIALGAGLVAGLLLGRRSNSAPQ